MGWCFYHRHQWMLSLMVLIGKHQGGLREGGKMCRQPGQRGGRTYIWGATRNLKKGSLIFATLLLVDSLFEPLNT